MGYYTTYRLESTYPEEGRKTILTALADIGVNDGDNLKWYSSTSDLQKISQKHPGIAFKISGVGEDYDDIWWSEYALGNLVAYWKRKGLLPVSNKTKILIDEKCNSN